MLRLFCMNSNAYFFVLLRIHKKGSNLSMSEFSLKECLRKVFQNTSVWPIFVSIALVNCERDMLSSFVAIVCYCRIWGDKCSQWRTAFHLIDFCHELNVTQVKNFSWCTEMKDQGPIVPTSCIAKVCKKNGDGQQNQGQKQKWLTWIKGAVGTHAPSRSNYFIFMQLLRKIWPDNSLASPLLC